MISSDEAKDILLGLVQGPDGEDWAEFRSGWSSDIHVCSWEGIQCDVNEAVQGINLSNTKLTASLPAALGRLQSLTHVDLSSNHIYGEIPAALTTLSQLVQLDLSLNQLRGKVPVFQSSDLEVLKLNNNEFSSELPDNVGDTGGDRLRIFDVKHNRLVGIIPTSIGQLSASLVELDLSNNKFSGQIPDALGYLFNLQGLFLSNNSLHGPIPASLTRSNLALSQIFLHGNELSGTLPIAFADLPNLKNLFIDKNKLTGVVPPELCALHLNEIFFQVGDKYNVDVRGGDADHDDDNVARSLQNYDWTQASDVTRDGCNSIACPAGSRSLGSGKEGVWPCQMCPQGFSNPYIGANMCIADHQFEIMAQFYVATNGQDWVGDYQSWTTEEVLLCDKQGISCNENGDVVSIVLPNSKLRGSIPENLGFLRHLEVLDLSGNELTGRIPSELRFPPIEIFDVSGNMLEGFVPPTLCEKSDINQNGENGQFSCDRIACAAGSYSSTGRAGPKGNCASCLITANSFLGSKTCGESDTASSFSFPAVNALTIGLAVTATALSILAVGCLAAVARKRKLKAISNDFDAEKIQLKDIESDLSGSKNAIGTGDDASQETEEESSSKRQKGTNHEKTSVEMPDTRKSEAKRRRLEVLRRSCTKARNSMKGQRKKLVKFQKENTIHPIPRRTDYPEETRLCLWEAPRVMQRNIQRNRFDWQNAVEEEDMVVCNKTGNRIHPVHAQLNM